MKKSQRFSNMYPDDAEVFEQSWDWDLLEGDLPYHTHKTSRLGSRTKRNRHKSTRGDRHIGDSAED